MSKGLPAVAVHDLVVHPRDNDLVVGTHGRSVYIADVEQLQQFNADLLASKLHVFELDKVQYNSYWGESWSRWFELYEPEISIPFYVNLDCKTNIKIVTKQGTVLYETTDQSEKGLNYVKYDLTISEKAIKKYESELNGLLDKNEATIQLKKADNDKYYIRKGTYKLIVESNGEHKELELIVE